MARAHVLQELVEPFEEPGESARPLERLVGPVADDQDRGLERHDVVDQLLVAIGGTAKAGSREPLHGVAAPAEVPEGDGSIGVMASEPGFEVAGRLVALDHRAADQDDPIAIGEFEARPIRQGFARAENPEQQPGRDASPDDRAFHEDALQPEGRSMVLEGVEGGRASTPLPPSHFSRERGLESRASPGDPGPFPFEKCVSQGRSRLNISMDAMMTPHPLLNQAKATPTMPASDGSSRRQPKKCSGLDRPPHARRQRAGPAGTP